MNGVKSHLDVWVFIMLLFGVAVGVFFRFYHLDQKTFWEDEIIGTVHSLGYTEAEIVRSAPRISSAADLQIFFKPSPGKSGNISTTVTSLALEDPQHTPLFYVGNRLWIERVGSSVTMLRFLPACYGCFAIVAMYWLGIELFRLHGTALIASAFLAVSPIAVLYSQEAREYSLWTLAVLVSSAIFLRACRLDSRAWWLAYAVSTVMGLYVYPLTALIIFGHGLYLSTAVGIRSASVARNFVAACLLAGCLFVPWLVRMNAGNGLRGLHAILTTMTSPKTIVLTFWRDIKMSFVDFGYTDSRMIARTSSLIGIALTVLIAFAIRFNAQARHRGNASFLLFGFVVPFVPFVAYDVIFHGGFVFQARYFIPVYLAVAFALASFLENMLDRRTSNVAARAFWGIAVVSVSIVGIISCGISSNASTWYNKDYERTPQVAAIVNRMRQPLVIADRGTSRVLGLGFYLDPSVAMSLNLHCDNCTVKAASRSNLIAGRDGYYNIVVIGRGRDQGSFDVGFEAAMRVPAKRLTVLQTQIFPRQGTSLNMFAAAF